MADFKTNVALSVAAVNMKRQLVIDIRDTDSQGKSNAGERKELNKVIARHSNDIGRVASMLLAANGITWNGKDRKVRK